MKKQYIVTKSGVISSYKRSPYKIIRPDGVIVPVDQDIIKMHRFLMQRLYEYKGEDKHEKNGKWLLK